MDGDHNGAHQGIEQYCWVSGTYTVPGARDMGIKGIGHGEEPDDEKCDFDGQTLTRYSKLLLNKLVRAKLVIFCEFNTLWEKGALKKLMCYCLETIFNENHELISET